MEGGKTSGGGEGGQRENEVGGSLEVEERM